MLPGRGEAEQVYLPIDANDARLEGAPRRRHGLGVAGLLGVEQSLVVLLRDPLLGKHRVEIGRPQISLSVIVPPVIVEPIPHHDRPRTR